MSLLDKDKIQRAQALDATTSFIVQAPAGSGKTELLIQRFLTLLNQVDTPEEILAITFTKKSANEMRLRIIKALKSPLSDSEPQSPHAKKTWLLAKQVLARDKQFHWNILDNPNQLRIQTIDALCAYLTKQLPLLSHFGSQPNIADNATSLYREAVQEVLTHVEEDFEWSRSISQLLLHLDNDLNKLHDLLVVLLAKRDQWLPYLHLSADAADIRKQLEQHLALVISDHLSDLSAIFPKQLTTELLAIARFAADNLALKNKASDIVACRDLIALPGNKPEDKQLWLGLATLLLTKSFSWRKRVDDEIGFPPLAGIKNAAEKSLHTEFRQRLTQLITTLSEHEALRLGLTELFTLPAYRYQDAQWEILKALLHVLKIVAAQLRVTFQQYGQIDFIENAQAALLALGSEEHPTDLALSLDYQIRHILVDEFQDTSFTQYQLLEKLTLGWETDDGRTLFIVGDPMQSIYRFRQAEVGIFIRMRTSGIGNIKLTPLTLAVNFRSTPHIVEWNNTHFEKIFPAFNDMATGAVNYSPSVSYQPLTEDKANTPISLHGFINSTDEQQAEQIVTLITSIKQQHPQEKIAILVRSRGHLADVIPALKAAKCPYSAIAIDPLASKQTIQDLLSLTCALLHPADRIAWLALLRSPWCGLTLADLLIIAGKDAHTAIWENIEKAELRQQMSLDGQARLTRIIPLLRNKIAERERCDLRSWVENTWLLLGGPAFLTDESEMADTQAYFTLLDEFSQRNGIINIDKLKEKIDTLFASAQHDDAMLQIMTIHTAKGLEFDTVILPHLERKIPYDDKALLSWMERPLSNDQIALLLAPIHATGDNKDRLYEYINRQQRIKSDYETDRLFYVATTRAKRRLCLFFNVNKNEQGDMRVEAGSFLQKIWPFLANNSEAMSALTTTDVDNSATQQIKQKQLLRASKDWRNPLEETLTASIAAHQQQSGFQLGDKQPQLIGVVLHRVLQLISQLGFSWWQDKTVKQQIHYLQHQLKQLGILTAALNKAADLTHKTIQHALTDARGLWILTAHVEAQSEFALTAMIEDKAENLVIDRTFVDEKGIRWIIDYKTTTFSHHDLEHFLAHEQKKYKEKMHKYYQAMALIDERPIRLGLYFPALPAWKEWSPEEV